MPLRLTSSPTAAPPAAPPAARATAVIFAGTFVGMFAYEVVKTLLAPELSLWESHAITIVFSSVVATWAGRAALRAQGRLHARLLEQTAARERVEAREAVLAETGARYRALVEGSPEATFLHVDGRVRYANAACARLLGTDAPAGLVGREVVMFVHPEHRAAAAERIAAAGRGELAAEWVEFGILDTTGARRVVEAASVLVEWDNAPAVQTLLRDVTARRRAERAMQESEQRFRSVTESATDAIVSANGQNEIVFWNAAAERVFGYTEAEALGASLSLLVPPEMRARHAAGIARAAAGGATGLVGQTVEVEGLRKDGTRFPMELSLSRWEANRQPFFTSIIRDVSTRKAAEAARREQHALLTAVMEGTTDAMWVKDSHGVYEMINGPGARMLGRAPAEVVGRSERDLFTADSAPVVRARDLAVLESGETRTEETESAAQADGLTRAYLTTRAPLRDDAGRVVGVIGVSRDITEQKEAQRALGRSHSLLEATLEATADAILVVDTRGAVTRVNRKMLDMWGIPDAVAARGDGEEMLAIAAGRLADPATFLAQAATLARHPDVVVNDVLYLADGRTVERHSQPQRVATGDDGRAGRHVAGRVFSFRDVTARVRAADALRDSEQRLRLALDAVNMVVWERDLASQAVTFHTSPTAAAGDAAEATVRDGDARGFLETVHPDDRPRLADASRRAREAGGAFEVEYRVLAEGGGVRWRHTSGRVFPGAAGRAARMVGVDHDITERKEHEEAIREREARLRLIMQQLPAVLWTTDADLRFTSCVGTGLGLVGLSAGDLVGERVPDLAPAAALAGDGDDLATAAHRRALHGQSATYEGPWGGVTFAAHVEPLRDADGRVVGTVGLAIDVTDRKRLEAQLAHQAFHDPLTGLANRALFRDRVEHALARCATPREGQSEHVAVLFLDLDDFKSVNDTLGHSEGDRLLVAVAERLQRATRGYDTVARLGGDEFAVLLEGMAVPEDADVVVARIVAALAVPLALVGREARARASVGLAHARPGETADELLRNADMAMYAVKASGKGRHAVFEPAMREAVVERLGLEDDLRAAVDALESGRGPLDFRLVYQPIVDLAAGTVVGFEALVRWTHARRGPVAPALFIPIAEETGLVVALGRWVLREACRQFRTWAREPHESPNGLPNGSPYGLPHDSPRRGHARVSVNVSGRQLEDPAFVGEVAAALRDAGLDPGRLTLEVTETAVMRDMSRSLTALHALKALGVRLAVDDFGTGYSSLSYLQRFPVDVLKIDKAFVDGVARGGSDAALARTIIALGQTLGLRTVAEGVERPDQRAALAALGCALGQGYLFARPLEAADAERLVAGSLAPAPG